MCFFITELIPESISAERCRDMLKSLHLRLRPIHNASVLEQVGPGYKYYCGTRKMCDCGTVLGSLRRGKTLVEDSGAFKKEMQKLAKKGWSQAKIQRWMDEQEKSEARQARRRDEFAKRYQAEAQQWVGGIRAFLDNGGKTFGLLVHFYSTNPESERISLNDTVTLQMKNITPITLMEMTEDTVYFFTL